MAGLSWIYTTLIIIVVGSKLDTSESIGKEYGVSKNSVIRLIRIDKLIDELKALVDSGVLSIRAGVELSFLSDETQAIIAEYTDDTKIDMKTAKKLRDAADSDCNIEPDTVLNILCGEDEEPAVKPKSVKISHDVFSRYFAPNAKKAEITETVEKALALYFDSIKEE